MQDKVNKDPRAIGFMLSATSRHREESVRANPLNFADQH